MTMRTAMPPRRASSAGSATVELVVMVPFVLVLTGLVWDLREFIAYRTDLAREVYALAEVMANETDTNPIATVIAEAANRFDERGAGSFSVAVVVRGTERGPGVPCEDDAEWCLPRVTLTWPAAPQDGLWGDIGGTAGGACATAGGAPLPARGAHFDADQQVLPNENPDGAASQEDWISRNMRPGEWWVAVDSCLDPERGLFAATLDGLGIELFDTSVFTLRQRVAWGSVHDLTDCRWCGP